MQFSSLSLKRFNCF